MCNNRRDKMKLTRHNGDQLVIVTCIMLVLLLIASTFIALCKFVLIPNTYEHLTSLLGVLDCHNASRTQEIYQHGHFWVLKNCIRAERDPVTCERITLTMQGSYEDVYKLEHLFLAGLNQEPVSFAVYVPTAEQLNRTLTAIAYVRNCVQEKNQNKETQYFIRENVNFHLYFYMDAMPLLSGLEDIETFVNQNTECKAMESQQELANDPEVAAVLLENSISVGRNIAQLAATTKFILRTDADTFPSAALFEEWTMVNVLLPSMNESAHSKLYAFKKLSVYRLPTFLISGMQISHQIGRVNAERLGKMLVKSTEVHNWAAFDSQEWLRKAHLQFHEIFSFNDYIQELLVTFSYFISAANGPLLDDRMGYTAIQSENLRIYEMLVQDYGFIVPRSIYVLHNITRVDLQPRAPISKMDSAILTEYAVMFDKK